jgi:hypothetical protein
VGVLIRLRRLRPAFARLNGFRGIAWAAPAVFHGPLPRALWSAVWSSLAKPAHDQNPRRTSWMTRTRTSTATRFRSTRQTSSNAIAASKRALRPGSLPETGSPDIRNPSQVGSCSAGGKQRSRCAPFLCLGASISSRTRTAQLRGFAAVFLLAPRCLFGG